MGNAFSGLAANRAARLVSSAASDNATKATDAPCSLRSIIGSNTNAAARYLKIYQLNNNLAVPTSSDTPALTIHLPATSDFAIDIPGGFDFGFGMGYRLTTGSADGDTGSVGAGDIVGLNLLLA
jgi:hypothetical protein